MQQIIINENEAGQRLDKFLHKYMPLAPSSFFYKMLRKKNITLNKKKAEGKEKLISGDILTFYLSDETISGFKKNRLDVGIYEDAYNKLKGIKVIYEDEHVVIMDKPMGILSQKAKEGDLSANEWLVGYLLNINGITKDQLDTYKPSICNRLDRNTSGLMIGAKNLAGSQEMNRLISNRNIRKFYRMFAKGKMSGERVLEGYLTKDEINNRVYLIDTLNKDKANFIKTRCYPLKQFSDRTLVEAEIITGKSHQIRIQMAGIGHPLLGDYKYGDPNWNNTYKDKFQVKSQLLYACRLEFPEMKEPFEKLSRKVVEASVPVIFQKLGKENIWQRGVQEGFEAQH